MLKLCIGVFIFEKRKFRNNFQSKKMEMEMEMPFEIYDSRQISKTTKTITNFKKLV